MSKDFIEVGGSLADVAIVRTLTPENDDQAAPIVAVSGSVSSPAASGGPPGSTAAVPASAVEAGPDVPGNTLAVKASGTALQKIEIRRGPGPSFGAVDELTVNDPVSVRGTNTAEDWVIVQAADSGGVGWVPIKALDISSSVTGTPPIVTGWIENNGLELRSGPGTIYNAIGPISIYTMVSILAANDGQDWIYVETLSGGQGWIPRVQLDIIGSLAGVPVFETPVAGVETTNPTLPAIGQTEPVRTGQLVFQTASGEEIMVINSDGTDLRRLTNGIDPVLSPDGQQVAFTRWQGETGALWVIGIDGGNERVIMGEMRKAKGPEWSPDARQIVLNFQHGGRADQREKCQDADRALPRGAFNVNFKVDRPDPQVCFTLLPDPNWTLRVINLEDGLFEDVDGGTYAFRPAWDPAQPWRVISDGGQGLLAVDINQNQRQGLTNLAGDGSPVFSPDGRFLVVTNGRQGSNKGHELYRLNADGSGRVRLTETPFWVPLQPDTEDVQWNNVAPVWSPDGTEIAFLTDRAGRWEIWIMNVDGSNPRPMFSAEVNDTLTIKYDFVDERVMSWR